MFWKFLDGFNFIARCRKYKLGLWECPNFLFLLMGILTIAAMVATFFASKSFDSEAVTIVSVTIVAALIITIGSFVIRGVENIAEANVIKNEFISVVSHQLCGPLSAIKWNAEVLENEWDSNESPEKKKLFLNNVKSANEKMLKLVNQLLEVNRIDEGRAVFRSEDIDLGEIADEILSELNGMILQKKIDVKKRIAPDLPSVRGDSIAVKTAIRNLISNAVKYSREEGKIEIDVKPEKKKILVAVRDWGVGIPKYQQRKVFEKFFRSDNDARYRTDGIGLGLYLTKGIIENMGGKLWFESEANKGSTFFVTIPEAGI